MSLGEETKKGKLKLGKKKREGKGLCLGAVEEKRPVLCLLCTFTIKFQSFWCVFDGLRYAAKSFNEASHF